MVQERIRAFELEKIRLADETKAKTEATKAELEAKKKKTEIRG